MEATTSPLSIDPLAPLDDPPLLLDPPPLPGEFSPDGRLVLRTATDHLFKLHVSTWSAFLFEPKKTTVGIGFGYGDPLSRWRAELQLGPQTAGVGIHYVVVPLIDAGIGFGMHYDFNRDNWTPAGYVAVARW